MITGIIYFNLSNINCQNPGRKQTALPSFYHLQVAAVYSHWGDVCLFRKRSIKTRSAFHSLVLSQMS